MDAPLMMFKKLNVPVLGTWLENMSYLSSAPHWWYLPRMASGDLCLARRTAAAVRWRHGPFPRDAHLRDTGGDTVARFVVDQLTWRACLRCIAARNLVSPGKRYCSSAARRPARRPVVSSAKRGVKRDAY